MAVRLQKQCHPLHKTPTVQPSAEEKTSPRMPARRAPVVYINGCPGVGKQTVAEYLVLLLGADKAFLIDTYALGSVRDNEPLTPENPQYGAATADALSRSLVHLLELPGNASRIAILANFAPDTPDGDATARRCEVAAQHAGRAILPVYLQCCADERMRRVQSLERRCSQRIMTNSSASEKSARLVASQVLPEPKLFVFPDREALTLNVTTAQAWETALRIVEFVNDELTEVQMRDG